MAEAGGASFASLIFTSLTVTSLIFTSLIFTARPSPFAIDREARP
jgi:hypothetical protein